MATTSTATPPLTAWHQMPNQRARDHQRPAWHWSAGLGAATGIALLVLLFLLWPKPVPSTTRLIFAASVTQQEGFSAAFPEALTARAQSLAQTGGGSVVGVVAAGSIGQEV